MAMQIVQMAFLTGFLCLWFGVLALWLSIAIHAFPLYWSSFRQPQTLSERSANSLQNFNTALTQAAKTRLNRLGQILVATGLALFMATGIAWLILRILANHPP